MIDMKRILLALAVCAASSAAIAANVAVSGLPSATGPLSGDEQIPCVQSGLTSRCTASSLMSVPVKTQTGNSYGFGCTDFYQITRRSGSGALTDSLPASTETCMQNGAWLRVVSQGDDDTVTAGSGTAFASGATDVVESGRTVFYVYDAVNEIWRRTDNTSMAAIFSSPTGNTVDHVVTMRTTYAGVKDSGVAIGSGTGNVCTNGGTCTETNKTIDAASNTLVGIKSNWAEGSMATQAANTTAYYPCQGYVSDSTLAETTANSISAIAGTLKNLRVHLSAPPAITQTVTVTLRINGAAPASGPSCALSATSSNCSDLVNSATISAGDFCAIEAVYSASAQVSRVYTALEFDQ